MIVKEKFGIYNYKYHNHKPDAWISLDFKIFFTNIYKINQRINIQKYKYNNDYLGKIYLICG